MHYDESLAQRIRTVLKKQQGITEKKMFGGEAFLLNGNMVFGIHNDHLVLRMGPEHAEVALKQSVARPFDITGRTMKGWIMVSPDGFKNAAQLKKWLQPALDFVSTLPLK